MVAAAMKHMASNFVKLDKFKGVNFRRWRKNIHFLLFSISVVYVLTTPILEDGEDATLEQLRRRNKWDNDDCVRRGLILKGMSVPYLIFTKMLNLQKNYGILWRPNIWLRMHQVRSSLFTQHKMNMDKAIQVSCIIDKLPSSWKDFKHTLKHLKEELTLVELDNHLRFEESPRVQDSDKPKGNNVVGPSVVNIVEHNNPSRYNDNKGKRKHHDNTRADPNKKAKPTCWKCGKTGHIKGIVKVLMLETKPMVQAQRAREAQLHARVDGKKIIITETSIRRGLQLAGEECVDCLPNSTIFEQLALIGMIRNLDNVSGKFLMYPRVGKGFSGRVTPLFPTMVLQSKLSEGSTMPTDPQQQ
nr:hypothetical protein [Tanacetum cinerariifolium]